MNVDEFTVWVFRNDNGMLALVSEAQGVALPSAEGPWAFVHQAKLSGTTRDEQHALALIDIHGFCCFDEISEEHDDG
ncbi:MAG: hypothetical protein JWR80_543 [Bradyrhizobium sp.]|nr:hypothetical protein [Bradyrhizobium sp.]